MKIVMSKLGIPIPEWRLHRRLRIGNKISKDKTKNTLFVKGVDVDEIPVSFIKSIKGEIDSKSFNMDNEPFQVSMKTSSEEKVLQVKLKLEFMGHYMEPEVELIEAVSMNKKNEKKVHLEYNPFKREWKVNHDEDDTSDLKMETLDLGTLD